MGIFGIARWVACDHGDGAISQWSAATDSIRVYSNQQGRYSVPLRHILDYQNALGEWPEKHILGTELGPNENGRPWPSRRKREHAAQ